MHLPKGHYLQNGKYRLTNVIGQGGFGITYSGVWTTDVKGDLGTLRTDVPVCIKEYFFKDYCLRDNDTMQVKVHSETGKSLFDKFKEKLIKEAKILSEVHHPNIVNVLEVFEENGTAYIAMEYIQGCSLKYMLETEGVLAEKKVLKYIYQIGQALEFVHQKNILHLDIKPNNILIDRNNNARLIDFGVSKRYDIEQQETSTTVLTLSKGFAAIEQYDSEGIQNFSPCPDIYSLGATMYNLLTGVIPTESILRATKPIAKPSDLNRDITPQTESVIMRAMQINAINRYQSVKQMINELDIPSYFEETENELSDKAQPVDEPIDGTSAPVNLQAQNDDEQTRDIESIGKENTRKKRKRHVLMAFFIIFAAFIGWAIMYWLGAKGAEQNDGLLVAETDSTQLVADSENMQSAGTVPQIAPEVNNASDSNKTDDVAKTDSKTPKGDDKTASQQNGEADADKTKNVNADMEVQYKALIENGKANMAQKNFAEAKADFTKARDLKVTDEVIRLLIACDEGEEEQAVIRRKALYEEKYSFGNLMIVRKISNGRYGAIDTKGNERIQAIYLGVAPSVNGRAFEREDHLYDIYDVNGMKVGSGLTTY